MQSLNEKNVRIKEYLIRDHSASFTVCNAFIAEYFSADEIIFTWPCSLVLSSFLCSSLVTNSCGEKKNSPLVCQKRVLELGAGTGLAGIVAGFMGAKEVVLSDRLMRPNSEFLNECAYFASASTYQLMELSIMLNTPKFSLPQSQMDSCNNNSSNDKLDFQDIFKIVSITCLSIVSMCVLLFLAYLQKEFDWNREMDNSTVGDDSLYYDVVLGADVLYSKVCE
jgi:hypothetical protein